MLQTSPNSLPHLLHSSPTALSFSSSRHAPLHLGSVSGTNFHQRQGRRLIAVHISFVKGPQGEEEGEDSSLLALPPKQFVSVEISTMTAN